MMWNFVCEFFFFSFYVDVLCKLEFSDFILILIEIWSSSSHARTAKNP